MYIKVQRSITINPLFYYLYTYIDIIYYHVPFFILLKASIAEIKKESAQCIIFDLSIYLRNKQNINNVLYNFQKF